MTVLLEARGLVRTFPPPRRYAAPVRAVDGVDLVLRRGEVVGLVGESGCGKSTLGRLLLRLVEADAGTIAFDGIDLRAMRPEPLRRLRSRMQLVHQSASAALNPGLTVEEHLRETMALHRPGEDAEAAIVQILTAFRLRGKRRSRPRDLSGGELRRVGLARCLLPRPDIVVADEPTAGLDASVKSDVLGVLKEAIAEDTAFLLISHELDVVRWMSDRVLVMHQGQIVQRMPAVQLDPNLPDDDLHPYTAQLLASGLDGAPRSEPSGRLESRGLET